MYAASFFVPSKRLLISVALVMLSILLAAYAPMASLSNAQSVSDSKLEQTRHQALGELDRRITNYKKTLSSMQPDSNVSQDGQVFNLANNDLSLSATLGNPASGASSSSSTDSHNGLKQVFMLPFKFRQQAMQFLQKIIDELTKMRDKVQNTTSLGSMQSLGSNIESQFKLDQLTQVQAGVAQAIQNMTDVHARLQSAVTDLHSQIKKIAQCASGRTSQSTSTMCTNTNGTGVNCADMGLNSSAGVVKQAKLLLANITQIVNQIGAVLKSVISLFSSLASSFKGMVGGLGNQGTMGNLGSLGSKGNLGGLGNTSGMLLSFTSILSQLGLSNGMANGVFGNLSNLSNQISI